jgi:hypothetical protein
MQHNFFLAFKTFFGTAPDAVTAGIWPERNLPIRQYQSLKI